MSEKFAPILTPGYQIGPIIPTAPAPNVEQRGPRNDTAVDDGMEWEGAQAAALMTLLLRCAYADDLRLLSHGATFIPGFNSVVRLSDASMGTFRPVIINCGSYRTVLLHGVVGGAAVGSVISDMIIPQYSAGVRQYFRTASSVGDYLNTWWSANEPSGPPVNLVCHSFGGVIGAYWAFKLGDAINILRDTTFGSPKIGPHGASLSLIGSRNAAWLTREDPIVGLPPSYIRLADVAILAAIEPHIVGQIAALAIKARFDQQWGALESVEDRGTVLNQDGTLGELRELDEGRNWYSRTGLSFPGVISFAGFPDFPAHTVRTYYERLRALFTEWSILSDAAGAGGRSADVLALALTAAGE